METFAVVPDPLRASVRLVPLQNPTQEARLLDQVLTVLGSAATCDIVLPADRVDGAHAAIALLGNTAYLCDLGAPGGTSLNGRRIRWARLAHGDQLAIGPLRFLMDVEESPELVTGEQPAFKLRDENSIGLATTIDPILIVGSDPGCDVALFDPTVAPRQCLVIWTQDGPVVRDLRGEGGVLLNGQATSFGRLLSGDRIGVGPFELVFEIETSFASPPSGVKSEALQTASMPREFLIPDFTKELETGVLVSGRLPSEAGHSLESLWPSKAESPPGRLCHKLEWAPAGQTSAAALACGKTVMENLVAGTDRGAGATRSKQASITSAEPPNTADRTNFSDEPNPANAPAISETPTQSLGFDERFARIRAQVAAAQASLDRRVRKQWERLDQERSRLRAFEESLEHETARAEQPQAGIPADANSTSRKPCGTAVPAVNHKQHSCAAGATAGSRATSLTLPSRTTRSPLREKVSDLARLVGAERDEIERSESRLEALRQEVQRLRGFVAGAEEHFKACEAEFQASFEALKQKEMSLRREREALLAKLRELDARLLPLRSQIEQARFHREDLEREAEELARAQVKLVEKEESLRISLEMERQRIRLRQAEIQRRTSGLAKEARDGQLLIEEAPTERRAAPNQQEATTRTHRVVLEEACRSEIGRTTAEVERMLSIRLRDIEAEMATRQVQLDSRTRALASAAESESDSPEERETAQTGQSHETGDIPDGRSAGQTRQNIADRADRLATLQAELEFLRDAVRKPSSSSPKSAAPAAADRSVVAPRRDRFSVPAVAVES